MLTKNINFANFKFKPKNKNLKYLKIILNENNQVTKSLKIIKINLLIRH